MNTAGRFQKSASGNPTGRPRDLGERNEVVFANALEDEKHGGYIARIGDKVRPFRRHCKRLARPQSNIFLGVLEKNADRP